MQTNNTTTITHGAAQPAINDSDSTAEGRQLDTPRQTMNGKSVYEIPATGSVINLRSGFAPKLLTDGPSFSAGISCTFSCAFCFVGAIPWLKPKHIVERHEDVVIRRKGVLTAVKAKLLDNKGRPRFQKPTDEGKVIYASPLVDVAGNVELAKETIEICKLILELTSWHIRLLSKSNLLPLIAKGLGEHGRGRTIYGVSTGTLDDELARAFECGTALVSKRIESLHRLQDDGQRTFGMLCPSIPQKDYNGFAQEMAEAIRADRCEHVWAEPINVRGASMQRTVSVLQASGFQEEARMLQAVSANRESWEEYSRATFLGHLPHYPPGKLRFLQYVTAANRPWWSQYQTRGAVLL
jgi:DNA repair photolyase